MAQRNRIKTGLIVLFSILVILMITAWQLGFIYIMPSRQKMDAEMDSLISIIERANPHLRVYEEVMGYSVVEQIKEQQKKIKDVGNIGDYYKLIYASLKCVPEIHCRLLGGKELGEGGFWVENYPEIFDKPTLRANRRIGHALLFNMMKEEKKYQKDRMTYSLYVSYIQGEYYVTRPVKKINGNDTVTIDVGMRLTKVNDIPVHDFLAQNRDDYFLGPVRWDFNNNRFFTERIGYPYSYILNNTPLYLTFVDTANRQEIRVLQAEVEGLKTFIDANKILDGSVYKSYEEVKPFVRMIDTVLFIKVPSMNMDDMPFYENEISTVANKSSIKKVIIDVRGNGGGSDNAWHHLLGLLTDTTLCRHAKMGFNDNAIFNHYMPVSIDSFPFYHDARLNQNYRLLCDDSDCDNIEPHEKSIRHKGKIYLLHDKNSFSAANSLVTFAITNDKIVAVGEPTGVQAGYGTDPFVYKLPFTKLCFMMHSVIHFPQEGDGGIDDYLWNKTEIPITPTIIYENIMEEYRGKDIYNNCFLYKYDPYFQAVLLDRE